MNLLRTIIVDDEPRGINTLQKLLELYQPIVSVVAIASSVDEAVEKIQEQSPQLIFLDIAMPVKNGFELFKHFGQPGFEVIFVTAHNQFMIDAFHFSAVDYLLKPVDEELLISAVQRAAKRIEEKTGSKNIETLLLNIQQKHSPKSMKLCIPSLKGFKVVELKDILFAESLGSYTNFYIVDQPSICASKPIHEYEELLLDAHFVRIHKSFLVNIEHVKEYLRGEGGSVLLTNNKVVEVSRRKKDLLLAKMKTFYKF